jgi:hypothetical protein
VLSLRGLLNFWQLQKSVPARAQLVLLAGYFVLENTNKALCRKT